MGDGRYCMLVHGYDRRQEEPRKIMFNVKWFDKIVAQSSKGQFVVFAVAFVGMILAGALVGNFVLDGKILLMMVKSVFFRTGINNPQYDTMCEFKGGQI